MKVVCRGGWVGCVCVCVCVCVCEGCVWGCVCGGCSFCCRRVITMIIYLFRRFLSSDWLNERA